MHQVLYLQWENSLKGSFQFVAPLTRTALRGATKLGRAWAQVLDNLFDQELQARVSEQLGALTGNDPDAAQAAISTLAGIDGMHLD